MISGEGHGKAADWWSLGVLLFEMLYGMPPFYNKNQNMMFQLIAESEIRFPPNPQISNEAKEVITGLLKKNQKQRIGFSKDLAEIQSLTWFKEIDWKDLSAMKVLNLKS